MLGDRLKKEFTTAYGRQIGITYFEGRVIDDILVWGTKAIATEIILAGQGQDVDDPLSVDVDTILEKKDDEDSLVLYRTVDRHTNLYLVQSETI